VGPKNVTQEKKEHEKYRDYNAVRLIGQGGKGGGEARSIRGMGGLIPGTVEEREGVSSGTRSFNRREGKGDEERRGEEKMYGGGRCSSYAIGKKRKYEWKKMGKRETRERLAIVLGVERYGAERVGGGKVTEPREVQ